MHNHTKKHFYKPNFVFVYYENDGKKLPFTKFSENSKNNVLMIIICNHFQNSPKRTFEEVNTVVFTKIELQTTEILMPKDVKT